MSKIQTILICEDCNTNQQSVRDAFREGEEGEAILNLEAARDHSGPDSFFLATITPVNENAFYKEHEHLIQAAHIKSQQAANPLIPNGGFTFDDKLPL